MKFIAAMDSSGGSAGKVLTQYEKEWTDKNKMELVHNFRMRMIACPSFTNDKISTAIVFKDGVERGIVSALKEKDIEAYLKIDVGMNEDGTMKEFSAQDAAEYAVANGCTGTKMRSVISTVDSVDPVLDQQFAIAKVIYDAGLMPIVEPEIDINNNIKSLLETHLLIKLKEQLERFEGKCILKLTLPEKQNYYASLYSYEQVYGIVALSGGYDLETACNRLKSQKRMSASFSRALCEGLKYHQTDDEFNEILDKNIEKIRWSCL